jgi:hypothetical protein
MLFTVIMSSVSQIINFAGSFIVVCISAAFLITTIAEIHNILRSLLVPAISELFYILRSLGTLLPFFLYDCWESWLFRELVNGNIDIRYVANYIIGQTLKLFHPLIEVETWDELDYLSDDDWEDLSDDDWEDLSDDEDEDFSDDDW